MLHTTLMALYLTTPSCKQEANTSNGNNYVANRTMLTELLF